MDAADQEFAVLAWLADRHGLSLAGVPAWRRPNGKVRGLSPRTADRHIVWLCSDLAELTVTEPERQALFMARKKSISSCADVRSIMAEIREQSLVDSLRASLSDDDSVDDPFAALSFFKT